jgi:putative sigma-54 modulation protein
LRLQMKGRNVEVTDSIRRYAEQKLAKLNRQLGDATRVELELLVEKNPSIADNQVAEATVFTKGPVLRAREASPDMKASIDQLTEKLLRQVTNYREKRTKPYARHRENGGTAQMPEVSEESQPTIVKMKQFPVKPMTAEEAVLQLELIGHDFFVFRNVDTDEVNVVYRRRTAGYGLIEPS